jgi:hypothetical protein
MTRRTRWAVSLLGIALAAWWLADTPPVVLLRAAAEWYGLPQTSSYAPSGGLSARVGFQFRRLLVSWIDHGTAVALRRRLPPMRSGSDVDALIADLSTLDPMLTTQDEVPVPPLQWSNWSAGLGYCDQVNGAVARVLVGRYENAEAYSVWTPSHTFGRVRRSSDGTWVYFDVFPKGFSVFTLDTVGRIVWAHRPVLDSLSRSDSSLMRSYEATRAGFTLNAYAPYFLGHLFARMRRADPPTPPSVFTTPASTSEKRRDEGGPSRALPVTTVVPIGDPSLIRRVIDARYLLLFGDQGAARGRLRALAGPSTIAGRIAAWFADSLNATGR